MLNYLELFGLFHELLYIRSPFSPKISFWSACFFFTCFFLLFLNCWIDVFIFFRIFVFDVFFKRYFCEFF